MIMGDVSDTLDELLSADGMDFGLLTEEEQAKNDNSNYSYTEHDKKVMRQWEGVAEPANRLCKFLQDDTNAWSQVTFELRIAIQDTTAPTVPIFSDISCMDRTKDLRNRGDKTVLVKKSGVDVSLDVANNYTKVEVMDPAVEKYCDLYAQDLSQRLGLDANELPTSLTNHVLMNPMFGREKRVTNSGLLTKKQYNRGRLSEYGVCIMLF